MSSDLKLAFAGTPALAATILQKLIDSNLYTVARVYTQPDKSAGRGRKLQQGAVKKLAESKYLPLQQPVRSADIDHDNTLSKVDLLIVAAYGMLLPESILNRPRLGCINVHTSLLPRWRGAAPIQRAIQAGDTESGITIMQMDAGLDTGNILLQKPCAIAVDETAGTLHDRLAVMGADLLLDALVQIGHGTLSAQTQDNALASYAYKISKAEAKIDWHLPAGTIERNVRAFNPFPVAHTLLNGLAMRIWEVEVLNLKADGLIPGTVVSCSSSGLDVASADRLVRIQKLQLSGRKMVTALDFHNGHQNFAASGQH